jgi:predicted nuclease of predicted toxin-antitoxin system
MQLDTAKILQDGRTLSTKEANTDSHLVCLLAAPFDIVQLPHGNVIKRRAHGFRCW